MGTSRSDRAEPYLLPAAAFSLPLAFGPFFRDAWGLPKLAAAAAFSAAGLAALARSGELFTLRSRVDVPLLAFGALALVSAAVSVDRGLSFFGARPEYLFSILGLAGCACAFALGVAHGRAGAARLAKWAVASAALVSVYALIQAAGFEPLGWKSGGALSWRPALPNGRAIATFGSPVELGAYLALALPLSLALAFERRGPAIAALALIAAALLATGTRAAIAAGGAACLLVAGRAHRRAALAVGAAAALALAGVWAARGTRGSDSLRASIWKVGLSQWPDAPWLGTGPGTFIVGFRLHKTPALAQSAPSEGLPRNAHDDLLEALVTTGALGLAGYAWLNASAAAGAAKAFEDGVLPAGLAAAALAVGLFAKVNPPFFAPAWLASAFAGCALSRPASSGSRGRLAGALALGACAWLAWAACAWARADRADLLGRLARDAGRPREAAAHFERAVAARPGVAVYVQDLDNTLWDAASAVPAAERGPLLARAADAARDGLRGRPLDSELLRILAQAERRRAENGEASRLAEAARAQAAAEALDPDFGLTQDVHRRK